MKRDKGIGFLFFLLGGVFAYFLWTNTPSPKPIGVWIIIGIFCLVALSGLSFFFSKSKPTQ